MTTKTRARAGAATGADAAKTLHELDFHAWALSQAAAVRDRRHADLDLDNLAEELEALGRSERREVESRLRVLLVHLLKARFQPEKLKGGRQAAIKVQRHDLARVLADNPSLRDWPAERLADEYQVARLLASVETGLPEQTFPEACPFSIDDVLGTGRIAG